MEKFKPKLTDVLISHEISKPYCDSIYDFIFDLNEHRKTLEKEGCYSESIVVSLDSISKYSEDGEDFFIKGYRPENKIEKDKRLKKVEKAKAHKNQIKETIKQKRYEEYLALKKEFEFDPMSRVELKDN